MTLRVPLRVPLKGSYKGSRTYNGSIRGLGFRVFKGPCTQMVETLGPMYLYREYFKAKVYILSGHMDPYLRVLKGPE